MKTVCRENEFPDEPQRTQGTQSEKEISALSAVKESELSTINSQLSTVWTMSAPGGDEKEFGKHPTQKPVALVERCLLAYTHEGDLVLEPFLGGGSTAVACVRLKRGCVGIELDFAHLTLAMKRADGEIIELWLREFHATVQISVVCAGVESALCAESGHRPDATQNDLDPDGRSMDRINGLKEAEPKTDCIFHETRFVFLSCAAVSSASVVHTTVDVSLQEAWAKTPNGKKLETTHVVRCQTEILRVKP